jgi:hypothetical protein
MAAAAVSMMTQLLVIAGTAGFGLWLLYTELATPGPSRLTTAIRRYGIAPYLVGLALLAGLLCAVLFPGARANIASLAVLAIPTWMLANVRWHLFRRTVLRARWVSVARSCGLGVTRDIRGRQWPFDASVTIGNDRVEYLPVITRPRSVPGVGVRYRLSPARGGTLGQVAEAAESLAAGLNVQRVEVTRVTPSRGELLAVWS